MVAWDDRGDLWCNHSLVTAILLLCFFASALKSEGPFLLVSLLYPKPMF